jgi:hypothetical protein
MTKQKSQAKVAAEASSEETVSFITRVDRAPPRSYAPEEKVRISPPRASASFSLKPYMARPLSLRCSAGDASSLGFLGAGGRSARPGVGAPSLCSGARPDSGWGLVQAHIT